MWKRNDSNNTNHDVQNRFTAYLLVALRRRKKVYLDETYERSQRELLTDPQTCDKAHGQEQDMLSELPPLAQIENQRLLGALLGLTERERYVFLARSMEERPFQELANHLGIGYKGVSSIYNRAVKKIRERLEKS